MIFSQYIYNLHLVGRVDYDKYIDYSEPFDFYYFDHMFLINKIISIINKFEDHIVNLFIDYPEDHSRMIFLDKLNKDDIKLMNKEFSTTLTEISEVLTDIVSLDINAIGNPKDELLFKKEILEWGSK